jgi:hypothetical protein
VRISFVARVALGPLADPSFRITAAGGRKILGRISGRRCRIGAAAFVAGVRRRPGHPGRKGTTIMKLTTITQVTVETG